MNKREVLYCRGQRQHFDRCLPALLRESWTIRDDRLRLDDEIRPQYFAALLQLQDKLMRVVKRVGTPRRYALEHVPAAAGAILQHYELWPTHFVDVTRSLPVAVSFAAANGSSRAYLYVFGLPDLRGSLTSDIDQHVTLARLEAVCPPAAKRLHHQDAYLVSRFPEPPLLAHAPGHRWLDWLGKTDLMRRLVAKFELALGDGWLAGAPRHEASFLIATMDDDPFARQLHEALLPLVQRLARAISSPT